jgi:hypothetical protein
VGVVSDLAPYSFLILHDFARKISWPRDEAFFFGEAGTKERMSITKAIVNVWPQHSIKAKIKNRGYWLGRDSLDLSESDITDDDLHQLVAGKGLETLHLGHTQITDRCLESLEKMLDLKNLMVPNTALTFRPLAQSKLLGRLELVDIRGGRVKTTDVDRLRKLFPGLLVWH